MTGDGAALSWRDVSRRFDPARLVQARQIAGLAKKDLASALGVSAAAVGQYEAGSTRPRPDVIPMLTGILGFPEEFFLVGRPGMRVDRAQVHFRDSRSPRIQQRRVLSFAEQAWELSAALERRVVLPAVDVPGFSEEFPGTGPGRFSDPVSAARAVRRRWKLGNGPVTGLVNVMEAHGIVVSMGLRDDVQAEAVGSFVIRTPRPVVVLDRCRAQDVYRHRFSAAHELGHLVMHGQKDPGSAAEREADAFAAEFLTPYRSIFPELPSQIDMARLVHLQQRWGVSVHSLIHRYREFGLITYAGKSRAIKRLRALDGQPGFMPEPVRFSSKEWPVMLRSASLLASVQTDTGIAEMACELAWRPERVREVMGKEEDSRPVLELR